MGFKPVGMVENTVATFAVVVRLLLVRGYAGAVHEPAMAAISICVLVSTMLIKVVFIIKV